MPRPWLTDYLQTFPFWLADIAPISTLSLPIFNPFFGFKSVSGPEISIETETINEANWIFDKKVVKKAVASPITLERGVAWYDSDFWRWTMTALKGDPEEFNGGIVPILSVGGPTPRRTMMLIHFFNRMVSSPFAGPNVGTIERALLSGGGQTLGGNFAGGMATAGTITALGSALNLVGLNAFQFAPRIPAKIYLLYGCIPSRYKMASDFDASSGEVSVSELEMQVEMVEHKSFEL